MVTAGMRAAATLSDQTEFSRIGEVLRDIARGGLSGAIVGIVVAGLGGRLVMRVVAVLHSDAVGAFTENGNRIGDITVGGTLFLIVFGLFLGLLAGVLWVIVSPWIPGNTRVRALLTAGAAIAIGTPLLIIGRNPDFIILDHDPTVVSLLVALVGLVGLSIALLDRWLDRRLPHAVVGRMSPAALYAVVTLIGAVLVLPFAPLIFLASDEYELPLRAGYPLLVVGLCTATWWALRVRGRVTTPRGLMIAARGAVVVAVILGVLTSIPHVSRAVGLPT
jgi:hypothetical protein